MLLRIFAIFFLVQVLVVLQGAGQNQVDDLKWYQHFFQLQASASFEHEVQSCKENLVEAKQSNHKSDEAHFLKELGLLKLVVAHDYDSATDLFVQALSIEDSLDLNNEKIFTYLALSQIFEEVGYYSKSAQLLTQALDLNATDKNLNILVYIMNKQGNIQALMGNIDEAFENYQQVLDYKDQLEQPSSEAEALSNIGHLYSLQGKYNEAIQKHKLALSIERSIKDRKSEAVSLNDIGELYRALKNDERALANHKAALEIMQSLNDQNGIAESYNNLGVLFFLQHDFARAIANLDLGLQAAQEGHSPEQQRKSYDFLSQCYEAQKEFAMALKYKKDLITITDFIQNEKNERKLLETQNRYVIDKKETQIDKLELERKLKEQEIQKQHTIRNGLFVIIGFSLIIILLTIYLYRITRQTNEKLEVVNEEVRDKNEKLQDLNATKDKFFSIISHDLKGPLNSLTSFSGLLINHIENLSKEEIQMLAKDLDKSIKNLFDLLENLLEWSRSQTGNIEFIPEQFLLNTILSVNHELLTPQAQAKKIELVYASTEELTVNVHKQSVNTVIRNLISNAIKFTPESGTITLNAKKVDNAIIVTVTDNGVGMPAEVVKKLFRLDTKHSTKGTANEKGTGLGLILCKEFIEKNGGRIWVESEVNKGSTFSFSIPSYQS